MRIRRLFLIDCLGALLTAFLSGIVLVQLETLFGMPRKVLYVLAVIALIYAAYSACCWFFATANLRFFLRIIAIANGVFCLLTVALLIVYRERLTGFGLAYFVAEICVILGLIYVEWRNAS